jgi:hypothetical protein
VTQNSVSVLVVRPFVCRQRNWFCGRDTNAGHVRIQYMGFATLGLSISPVESL